ncbi:phage major capsid protein [Streptomyces sp. A3M-1-3]|uniref:phage major capsid protein n=1 Tax=Streptomyces sp. A3M-1-3 TaxID=2962044 RepID=UPI0020B6D0C0|nr:phage major capsid protein [Streptomyces sp. A3M-1-3]MCP3820071.1 phage major capsid protein [Streptomyces sp. A3M-1-3]
MSAQLTRLVDEQNTTWKRMQDIQSAADAENRDLTAEERSNWDAAEARLTVVSGDIERLNRMAALESIDRSQIVTTSGGEEAREIGEDRAKQYRDAFGMYLRGGMEKLSTEQRMLLMDHQVDVRAQSTGVDTAGGFLVPEGFRDSITETMKAYGGILSLATVINTSTGNDLPWPTNDDTSNEGEILGENTAAGEQDVTLGQRKLKAYTFSSKQVKVALQLLQDSAFNLDQWLPGKLGERIGRRVAGALATGTGVDQPEGITTNTTVGKQGTTGQTTSIIYDDLVDLEHSVDMAYRANARYVMNDAMLKVIRKLKDTQGRPLWVPIPAPGFPATINGFQYTIDNKMPVPAASAKTIVFGDIAKGYLVRQVQDVQMMRLTERYAEYLQVAFLGFSRLDGMVDDSAAIRLYQHSAS